MKEKIMDINELSDSREMLEASIPNFITFFIVLLLLIFIIAFAWMWFGEIDIIVKANGIVRPGQTISVVRSSSGGVLEEVNYYSGKRVEQGERLFSIDSESMENEKQYLEKQINDIETEIDKLKLLKESIENEENLFADDLSYRDMNYYYQYLVFKNQYRQMEIEYERAHRNYQRSKNLDRAGVTESQLEELESDYIYVKLRLENLKPERLVEIENQIKANEREVEELKQRKNSVKENIELATKKAPISGTVQSIQDFNSGDYLPAGVEVLRIIPHSESNHKMELTVSNEDISKLEIGQEIRYRFLALPYREYGVLTGEVTEISEDVSVAGVEEGQGLDLPYEARATIDGVSLKNDRGEEVYIKPGMVSEARVVVRSRKILYVVLDKLDFIN